MQGAGERRHEAALIRAAKGSVFCRLGEETVLLNYNAGRYFVMDEVGAFIWSLLQQPRTVEEVRQELFSRYDVDRETCERDLEAFLDQLAQEGLLD
jgi:hypothetical protein